MLLSISNEHLEHLSFLHKVSEDIVKEFVGLSVQFLTNGVNQRIFKAAAQKLNIEEEVIENAIFGLMQLFVEAAKYKLTCEDLHDSLLALEFDEFTATTVKEAFESSETRHVLTSCLPSLPEYDNLEWRFDVKLATRSLHQQITPIVRIKLHTSNGKEKCTHLLQTDPVNLRHMSQVIDEALNEMKTNHVRRILRNIT